MPTVYDHQPRIARSSISHIEPVARVSARIASRSSELTPTAARKALGAIASASVDLPAAERLGDLLHEIARAGEAKARGGAIPEFDEIVEDFLVIERVAPGRIWFLGGVGPIKVPEAASAAARPGWTVNLVLGRRGAAWEILEVGNVYPETLA